MRLLEDRPGSGRVILPGDQVRVEFSGHYASGEEWGRGPLTFIVGSNSYPGAVMPLRVGAVERMQYIVPPSDTTSRLAPFQGVDTENEAYQVRHDRGQIVVEHRVVAACRQLKVHFLNSGLGPIESDIGCWRLPRTAPPATRMDERLKRALAEVESGMGSAGPDGKIVEPGSIPRRPADTTQFVGKDGLHRAAREGRPEIVSWLIARGRDPGAPDAYGLAPIHYVGYAQRPFEKFVPGLEQSYLDVVDTLLAHGAAVDARVTHGIARFSTAREGEDEGQSALGFAGTECADRLVARLLERGASADGHGVSNEPPLIGAASYGCPETIRILLAAGAHVDLQTSGGGTALERLISVSAFHEGHFDSARLLVGGGAQTATAVRRLEERLKDPGQGGFGFSNRPQARRILELLKAARR